MRKLGAGGMGIVHAAYDEELDRKVAIKLVRAGVRDDRARVQTLREAKAMARLSHPNVVQVYEVGEHEGQVYLAMEYVQGETLRAWLTGRRRSWREVVAMFCQCGAGLAAAHAAGLVHRDFKPENTLVGADARARVLDFGLACAHPGERREPAARAAPAGTPAYMAPEQHAGASADARSDQYSFCVTFWEALYGHRPSAGPRDEPGPVRGPRDAAAPTWVRRILERGLAVEPDARWPTMAALLEQLARDPRRTRLRLATGILLAGLLVALALVALLAPDEPLSPCAGGRQRLASAWNDERDEAVHQAFLRTGVPYAEDSWRGVHRLLGDYASTWVGSYGDACLAHRRGEQSGTLLDLRMACLERRRAGLDALVDIFVDADPDIVEHAVRGAGGLPPVAGCDDREALTAELPPPADPEVAARVAAVRDDLASAAADTGTGRFARGRQTARASVDAAVALGYRPLEAEAWLCLGRLHEQAGEPDKAEDALSRAYWAAESARHDATKADAAALLIAVVGVRLTRQADVEPWVRLSTALVERLGPGGEADAAIANSLGGLARHQGDFTAALAHYRRALELYTRLRGPDHPLVAGVRNNMGAVFAATRRPVEALEQFERAGEILAVSPGRRHPLYGDALINLGNAHAALGELELAAEHQERALALYAALGPGHPNVPAAHSNLSTVHMARGDWDLAREHLAIALALRERSLALDHPDIAVLLNNTALVHLADLALADAARYFESAREILAARRGPRSPQLFFPMAGLGRVALAGGRARAAAAILAEALSLGEPVLPDSELADARFALARARVQLGDTGPASLELARRARDSYRAGGPDRRDTLEEIEAWMRSVPGGS